MGAHARLSPSSAAIWTRCPGSIALCEDLPDESTSWAREGTAAHTVREDCLLNDEDVEDHVGRRIVVEGEKFKVKRSWARAIQPGIDRIRDFGGLLVTERRVYWHRWGTGVKRDQFGTMDTGVALPWLMVVCDFKFGKGVPVDPEENEQVMIYGLGFYEWLRKRHPEITDKWTSETPVLFIIDQPRCAGGGGEWQTTLGELKRFGRKLRKQAAATYEEDAPLVPGEHCKWCKAAAMNKCRAFDDFNAELIGAEFDDMDEPMELEDPEEIKATRRAYIARHKDMILKWVSAIAAQVLEDALAGRPTPGLKAKVGRKGARQFDKKKLKKVDRILEPVIGEKRFTKKLRSPAQLEGIVPNATMRRL